MAAGMISNQKPQGQKEKSAFKSCFVPTYTFKDEQTMTLFHLLKKRGMLHFPNNPRVEEARKTDDSRYCLYNHNLGHSTKECYMLKSKIQALIKASNQTEARQEKGIG